LETFVTTLSVKEFIENLKLKVKPYNINVASPIMRHEGVMRHISEYIYTLLKIGSCGNSKRSCSNSKRSYFWTKMSENDYF